MIKTKLLYQFLLNVVSFIFGPLLLLNIFSESHFQFHVLGFIVSLFGFFLYFRAITDILHFGQGFPLFGLFPKRLVNQGLYTNNRHPIIWATLLYILGLLMSYSLDYATITILLSMTFILLTTYTKIMIDRKLLRLFNEDFITYKNSVPFLKWKFIKSSDIKISLAHQIVWFFSVIFFSIKYRISVTGFHHIPLKPPFVVVAPHQCYFDPFLFGGFIPYKVHYITTADVFKSKFLKFGLDAIGTIPIRRHVQDLKAIRKMLNLVKRGQPVGIFPEGGRTMDGRPLEIAPETIKFIQKCNAPILPLKMKGAFEIWPRWSKVRRSGKVEIEFQPVIPVEDQGDLDTLTKRIKSSIFYDETNYSPTTSKRRGHGLNELLWSCPECHENDTIQSDGKMSISCRHCHEQWDVSPKLHLIGKQSFTIASWLDTIRSDISPLKSFDPEYDFEPDENAYLFSDVLSYIIDDEVITTEN